MSKIYVVVERAYEYNDEYYYHPECGGVEMEHAYTDKDKAKEVAEILNAKAFKDLCIGEYDESLYENDDVFTEFDPTGKLVDQSGNVEAKNIDDLKKIANFFGKKYDIVFYTVKEVGID